MTYTVYGAVRTRTFRVLWLLEELGVPYTHHAEFPHSPEVLALNPRGKVPVLKVVDRVLTDSSAMLNYLADAHGAFTAPSGSFERAEQDAMMFRLLDEVDALLWTAARHSFILPEDERVGAVKPTCKLEYQRNIDRLMDEMSGDFLMGDTMTITDIVLCHCANWAGNAGFPEPDQTFATYLERLRARPAFQAVMARLPKT
ncbi:MAG: glutathione S-transferase family protein [Pelagimonas sp.]